MGFLSKEKRNIYSATKSALLGLARASALDLGTFGITVNCIAPGPFLTDLPMSMLSEAGKESFRRSHRPGPLGRSEGTGRPGPAAGQRRRQLHHRPNHRRRWRLHGAVSVGADHRPRETISAGICRQPPFIAGLSRVALIDPEVGSALACAEQSDVRI